jgi:hypothetical protein
VSESLVALDRGFYSLLSGNQSPPSEILLSIHPTPDRQQRLVITSNAIQKRLYYWAKLPVLLIVRVLLHVKWHFHKK